MYPSSRKQGSHVWAICPEYNVAFGKLPLLAQQIFVSALANSVCLHGVEVLHAEGRLRGDRLRFPVRSRFLVWEEIHETQRHGELLIPHHTTLQLTSNNRVDIDESFQAIHICGFLSPRSRWCSPQSGGRDCPTGKLRDSSGEGFMTRLLGRQDEMHSSMP